MTDLSVAAAIGITIDSYWDIEVHKDEIYTVPQLRQVKKLCDVLGFQLLDLFGIRCAFCEREISFSQEFTLPRNEIIKKIG